MKRYNIKIQVLSPIHIGSGEQIDPLEYVVDGNLFFRLDINRFLSELPEQLKKDFYTATDSANPVVLRHFFLKNMDYKKHQLYQSVAQPSFIESYKQSIDDPKTQLLVNLMTRSPGDYKAYIPGSSIKGAIRTAVISTLANQRNIKPRNFKKFENEVLQYRDGKRDPFRCLRIADASLPAVSTYIDRVQIYNPESKTGPDPRGIQMFYEMCFSMMDEEKIAPRTTLHIDDQLPRKKSISNAVSKGLAVEGIIKSCKDFYLPKIESEHNKFYRSSHELEEANKPLLDVTFGDNEFPLRLGRFSHIECTTVDTFRNPGGAAQRRGFGNTRTLCDGRMAMGWAKVTVE